MAVARVARTVAAKVARTAVAWVARTVAAKVARMAVAWVARMAVAWTVRMAAGWVGYLVEMEQKGELLVVVPEVSQDLKSGTKSFGYLISSHSRKFAPSGRMSKPSQEEEAPTHCRYF